MSKIYLASSALMKENFDGLRTIEEAKGYDGVQLFVNKSFRENSYTEKVADAIKKRNLGLIIHLPDIPEEKDLKATEYLVALKPDAKVIIHYMPCEILPSIKGTKVGWENAKPGSFDPHYVETVRNKVKEDSTFFIFDIGRNLYSHKEENDENIILFTKKIISELNNTKDFMHIVDKSSWIKSFRESWCKLGEGICKELVPSIKAFDGIIVLEYEDLELANDALVKLKNIPH